MFKICKLIYYSYVFKINYEKKICKSNKNYKNFKLFDKKFKYYIDYRNYI